MIFFGQVKRKATECLKKNWVAILITVLLVSLLNIVSQIVVDYITYPKQQYLENVLMENMAIAMENENVQLVYEIANEILYVTGAIMIWQLINVAVTVISFIFTLSTIKAYVTISKGEKYSLKKLELNWKIIKKSFVLEIIKTAYILLWSLLLIVPGIIKMFAYSQAYLIQIENPDKKAIDCLKESEAMMNGKKMEFFSYRVSFIGWYVVCALIVTVFDLVIFSIFKAQNSVVWTIVFSLLTFLVNIPLTCYVGVSDVFYYEALKEERKRPRQVPFIFYGPPQGTPNSQGEYKTEEPFGEFKEEKEKGEEKDPFSDF